MIKTVPFHSEHLKLMDMRTYEWEKVYPYLSQTLLDYYASLGHAYTFLDGGKIITCLGWVPLWPGVYEIWQIPSSHIIERKIEYVKVLKDFLLTYAQKLKVHRAQTHSIADVFHDAYMVHLGFECEGTLREYSQFKEDYRLWSRRFTWEQ